MAIWTCVAAVLCCHLKPPLTASSFRALSQALVLSSLVRLTISRASLSRSIPRNSHHVHTQLVQLAICPFTSSRTWWHHLVHSCRHPSFSPPSRSIVSGTTLSSPPSGTRLMTRPTPGREYGRTTTQRTPPRTLTKTGSSLLLPSMVAVCTICR